MELYPSPGLKAAPGDPLEQYAARLPLSAEQREALLKQVRGDAPDPAQALARVHAALSGELRAAENASYASIAGRLELGYGASCAEDGPALRRTTERGVRLASTPPLARTSMAPHAWPGAGRSPGKEACAPPRRGYWHTAASVRRVVLLAAVLVQTYFATGFMAHVLPYGGTQPLEIAILALFALLFGWVSAGFWTAMAGFVLLCVRRDRFAISARAAGAGPIDPAARTAVVMAVYNEDVSRVFAGIRAMYESLERANGLDGFDFYVLSDSSDADARVAEMASWIRLCGAVNGFGRVFYRWRRHRIKRKSGNIADFCRRWGSRYRYMVVLDADSVMSGACLMQLVRLMEANPGAGIIQTLPQAVGRDTLHARVQQFASRLYGPVFTAGLHFWQLGESHYWGHNAIIRVAPFIRHCALGRLPGRGSLSGEILSHDFVEAALMRRAGLGVWIAYDLPGSYEEVPPNLVDEVTRDRRWCQGNLMNFRLFLMKGLHPAHRAVFMTGVMAYVSAPLWFALLLLSTALLAVHTLIEPQYFVKSYQLFPLWPAWHPERAIALFGATATLLFLPKILSVLLIAVQGARAFGGIPRLFASMLGELFLSMLLAPIRMLFHTHFVLAPLIGRGIHWKSPPREDAETGWAEALRRHGLHTALGVTWAGIVYALNPAFLWWLAPVAGALTLSIPLSVHTSRVAAGRALREAGLFVTPEEREVPEEIRRMREVQSSTPVAPDFIDAIVDPVVNALVCASGVSRQKQAPHIRAERLKLADSVMKDGPDALSPRQKLNLLSDPLALSQLHIRAWAAMAAPAWAAQKYHRRAAGAGQDTATMRGFARRAEPAIAKVVPAPR